MLSNKDYTKMPLDELESEMKKLKSQKTLTVVLVGFFVGIAIWSATHEGGFLLPVSMLIFAAVVGSSYSKKLKSIRTEISQRNAVR